MHGPKNLAFSNIYDLAYGDIAYITKNECINERKSLVKGDNLTNTELRDNWETVRDRMQFSIIH